MVGVGFLDLSDVYRHMNSWYVLLFIPQVWNSALLFLFPMGVVAPILHFLGWLVGRCPPSTEASFF